MFLCNISHSHDYHLPAISVLFYCDSSIARYDAACRALLSRLGDGGESARRALAAVEAELAGRAVPSVPPPLESRRDAAAAEVDRLARRMARMEWGTSRRHAGEAGLRSE